MESMNKLQLLIYNKMDLPKFLFISLILCLGCDFIHCLYAKHVWLSAEAFNQAFGSILAAKQIDPNLIPQNELDEIRNITMNTFWLMLYGFMFINAIFYFLFTKLSKWGVKYTRFIVLTSLFLVGIAFLNQMMKPDIWLLASAIQFFAYLFVWLGFKHYPELKNSER